MDAGSENRKIMSKNLRIYMDLRRKTRNDICSALGLSYSTVTDWINGNAYPRIDKIEMLAKYFGIDKSDLIEDKSQEAAKHSEEYVRLTNLCNIGFKSIMTWTEDSFYKEYETIALRDHLSDLFYRYKDILETINRAKRYWDNDKDNLIDFYRRRDPSLTDRQIKEIFLKQEIGDKIADASNWVSGLPSYIAKIEEQYENNNELSEIEKMKYFARSANKNKV